VTWNAAAVMTRNAAAEEVGGHVCKRLSPTRARGTNPFAETHHTSQNEKRTGDGVRKNARPTRARGTTPSQRHTTPAKARKGRAAVFAKTLAPRARGGTTLSAHPQFAHCTPYIQARATPSAPSRTGGYRAFIPQGKLITIEGLDGAGKSTLARALAAAIAERGVHVELLREPGGIALSERIRELVKDPSLTVGARAEALLYAAARAELVQERVTPLLEGGAWVLLDRFVDSSLAYQGAGRGLGVERVRAINLLATAGLVPDRTLLLRIAPATGRARQRARGAQPDRIELEGERFFETIALAYERLAEDEPGRIRAIDAEQPSERVLEHALVEIEDLLPSP
jgi:dTMP kinase